MPARLSAFVIWALVAAGLVFWGYRLWASPLAAPANAQVIAESSTLRGDFTRMLGTAAEPLAVAAAPVVESNRFRLYGVLAPKPAGDAAPASAAGVALIAVDGKPARAYAVGARLDDQLVLQSVSRRSAAIGPAQGAPSVVLELPPPAAPATGSLPRAVAGDGGRAPAPMALPTLPPPVPQIQRQQAPPQQADEADDDEPVAPQRRVPAANPANR